MNLPGGALTGIACIVQGLPPPGAATPVSGRFSIPKLSEFFEGFGGDGLYPGAGSPDATGYVLAFLNEINNTAEIDRLVCAIPGFCASHQHRDDHPNTIAYELNKVLRPWGYRLKKATATFSGFSSPAFIFEAIDTGLIETATLTQSDTLHARDSLAKARERFEAGDYSGAISSSYTLVEELLKELLSRYGVAFSAGEGDIRGLYNALSGPMRLNPAGENIEGHLKTVLQGLKSQIVGIYNVANKAGDRHAGGFVPGQHHAKLTINAAFAVCEFLLDCFRLHQQQQETVS